MAGWLDLVMLHVWSGCVHSISYLEGSPGPDTVISIGLWLLGPIGGAYSSGWIQLIGPWVIWLQSEINILRPRQNGRQFTADIFKCIFFNENAWISIDISMKFVPKGQIKNISTLVQIMAWHRLGAKPLSESMMVSLLMHICVTRPQWLNNFKTHIKNYE